eukprot:839472-Prorocentrum_minimum.AAC.1
MAARMDPAELMVMVNIMRVKEDIRRIGLPIRQEVTLLKAPPPKPPAPPELWDAACTPKANPLLVESVWWVTAASLCLVSFVLSSSASLGQSRP